MQQALLLPTVRLINYFKGKVCSINVVHCQRYGFFIQMRVLRNKFYEYWCQKRREDVINVITRSYKKNRGGSEDAKSSSEHANWSSEGEKSNYEGAKLS